jgi:hypothetical protein
MMTSLLRMTTSLLQDDDLFTQDDDLSINKKKTALEISCGYCPGEDEE